MLACEVGDISLAPQIILHIVGCSAELHCLPDIGTVDIVAGRLDALIPVPGNTSTNCSISVQILRADGSFRAKRPEKSAGRKAADLDCGVTIRCSLSLWTAPYVYSLLCRFPRMSFFYPCSGVSPQRCLAHSLSERFSQSHIPFGRLFSFQFAPQLVGSEKGRKLTSSIINWELFCRLHERIFVNFL